MRNRLAVAAFALCVLWTLATASFLLVVSALILKQPRFPLNLGIIKTIGLPGLSITLLPAGICLIGFALLSMHRKPGAVLLAGYSIFWAALAATGFPAIWNAKRTFCLNSLNFCIISPWVSRLTLTAIILPFLLSGLFFWRHARNERGAVAHALATR